MLHWQAIGDGHLDNHGQVRETKERWANRITQRVIKAECEFCSVVLGFYQGSTSSPPSQGTKKPMRDDERMLGPKCLYDSYAPRFQMWTEHIPSMQYAGRNSLSLSASPPAFYFLWKMYTFKNNKCKCAIIDLLNSFNKSKSYSLDIIKDNRGELNIECVVANTVYLLVNPQQVSGTCNHVLTFGVKKNLRVRPWYQFDQVLLVVSLGRHIQGFIVLLFQFFCILNLL